MVMRVCVSVCVSAAVCPHYCTDSDVIIIIIIRFVKRQNVKRLPWRELGGVVGDAPSCVLLGGFAIGARVALLWQHYGNAWKSPAVICQAHGTHAAHAHYACR